jgi:DNA-directed RNA polymerase
VRITAFQKQAPGLYLTVKEEVKAVGSYRIKRERYRKADERSTSELWVAWTTREKLHVGAWMADAIMRLTGLVERVNVSDGKRRTALFRPSEAMTGLVLARDEKYEVLLPWFLPTTEPPVPWTAPVGGGYREVRLGLVKETAHPNGTIDFEASDTSTLFAAINAVDATPWQVNRDVYEVAQSMFDMKLDEAGLAPFTPVLPPPKPEWLEPDTNGKELPPDLLAEFKAWKRARAKALTADLHRASHILSAHKILEVADLLKKEERIYFPHMIDWRGRAYPRPLFLNPQERDLSRGCLRFAKGKPVGKDGGEWLAIHGANCWGKDKVPFAERVEWVLEHTAEIEEVYADPLVNRWWAEADAPFQFLAFCLEWAPFVKAGCPEEYVSHLPVSMDGSCNGFQHFSAMLRDTRGARSVNLVPGLPPQDVYAEVAKVVHVKVSELQVEKLAREWLASGHLDRSIVKRQVMTTPYGVTERGAMWQLTKHMDREKIQGFENVTEASKWLSPHVWEAIGTVVSASRQAMAFLQQVASICADHGQGVRWATPHGLVIEQRYHTTTSARVFTRLMGVVQLFIRQSKRKLWKRKQTYAISPNVVHSFDAAHMMHTIRWCEEMEVSASWAVVHDSFGCHAADAPLLAEVLRVTFAEQYRCNQLEVLRDGITLPEGVELPEPPPQGDLNVNDVIRAEYFFA